MSQSSLPDLVALGEGFTTEFKRSGTTGLGREICAFTNATGGTILLGVEDEGEVCGVADHNRLNSEVQSIALSADPPIAVEIEMTIPDRPRSSKQKYRLTDRGRELQDRLRQTE